MHDGKLLHPNELALSVPEFREKGDAGLGGVSGAAPLKLAALLKKVRLIR
jgi:hypothetical protein